MENSVDIKKLLTQYTEKSIPYLRSYLKNKIDQARKVGDINVELLTEFKELAEKGKKIRGMLVVLGYQIAGGKDMKSIYDLSNFIEIMHCGAIIHDDIMDSADYRRGIPTIHKHFERYGKHTAESLAIMAGDMSFYLSWDKLLNSNFPIERITEAGKIYATYALNTVYGQTLDALSNQDLNLKEKEILNIFRYKTAEYTGVLPLLIGATLGGMSDKNKLDALIEYGLALGWAFQIQDDILGLYGSSEKIGKPVGSDLREGKTTLLVHYIIKNGTENQKGYLKEILSNKSLKSVDIRQAQKFFRETGADKYVLNLGWSNVKKGKEQIPLITKNKKMQRILESLITFVMNRVV